MANFFTLPTHPDITKLLGRPAKVYYGLFDSPAAMADFGQNNCRSAINKAASNWGYNVTEMLRKAREGDQKRVEASDKLLDKFEQFTFATSRKTWTDDMAGSIPNVPAFVAGHPLGMRRRIKRQSAAAPLAVIVSLSSSAGVDDAKLNRRGAAILALVRILSARRPVELWAGSTLDADSRKNAYAVFARIETAPLDLATAAHIFVDPSFDRGIGHGIGYAKYDYRGDWPFGNTEAAQTHCQQLISPGFPHVSEALCIPPVLINDVIVADPAKWIEEQLGRYAIDAFAD